MYKIVGLCQIVNFNCHIQDAGDKMHDTGCWINDQYPIPKKRCKPMEHETSSIRGCCHPEPVSGSGDGREYPDVIF
jgi:hypothetical protein